MHFYQLLYLIIWQLGEILSISPLLELLIRCLVHCSDQTEDDRANALLPKTSELPHTLEGVIRLNP